MSARAGTCGLAPRFELAARERGPIATVYREPLAVSVLKPTRRPRIILVRELATSMGCCASRAFESDILLKEGESLYPERRAIMEALGPLYRRLREAVGDRVEIEVVDPRNFLWFMAWVLKDAWHFGLNWRETLRTIWRVAPPAVIVNGYLYSVGEWPDADVLIHDVEDLMPANGKAA